MYCIQQCEPMSADFLLITGKVSFGGKFAGVTNG